MAVVVGSAEGPSEGPCMVPLGPYMDPLVLHLQHTGPGSGTGHMPGQQHREAFVGHRKLDVCGRAVAEGRTLSRSVGHRMLVGGCMQSAADPHLDNADRHNYVGDPGAVDEEKLEGPGAVDGEDLEGLGAVGGEVVDLSVGAAGHVGEKAEWVHSE